MLKRRGRSKVFSQEKKPKRRKRLQKIQAEGESDLGLRLRLFFHAKRLLVRRKKRPRRIPRPEKVARV
jgi:hypothetical protein